MTAINAYDPFEPLGDGAAIIEASAGTGKTFTIAALVTRLVAEEGIPLDRILVVTFTRAATAELKDRIRRRLVSSLRMLRDDPGDRPDDDHMKVLQQVAGDSKARYVDRLDKALTHFDQAQIFTIHGFTSRLLSKLGFRSRISEDVEPGEIDEMILRSTAADLVVRHFGVTQPDHPGGAVNLEDLIEIGKTIVATPDARLVPAPTGADDAVKQRVELAQELDALLARRRRARGMVTFDDTLVEARDTLTDPRVGDAARELLERRYSIALIDEAQDTDPIQWQILRAVFDRSRLVVIGDPKQSIYAFRGADIESYLSAVQRAVAQRTLETNWRSDGPLVAALDTLLAGATFGDHRIGYRPVRAAHGNQGSCLSGVGAPLEIRRFSDAFPLPRRRWDRFFYIQPAREAVARDLVSEIVRLLTSEARLIENTGARPVGPGDIAVLCRTGRQVETVREALRAGGVPSVVARTGSVFATAAAEQWRRFLLAAERPSRPGYLRLAATSVLVGMTPRRIADLEDDAILALQQRFIGWQSLMHNHGVPAMFAEVVRTTSLTSRVLAGEGGERMLTDLNHIAEELHSAWRRGRIGSLVVWIERAMEDAVRKAESGVEDVESRQRRLDTDAAAVQVLTIHAAKGLEFPIVMVPYLWDMPRITPRVPVFHDPAPAPLGEPKGRLIDVGGRDSPHFDTHKELAMEEETAEEGRLLYVALTRAKHRLVAWWIENTEHAKRSKFSYLLTEAGEPGREVERLIERSRGTISQTILDTPQPVVPYNPDDRTEHSLLRAGFDRTLDYEWRRVSFSSLSPDRPLEGGIDTAEEPDRIDEVDDGPAATGTGGVSLMADLPRGPRFGSFVHRVLQEVPFDAPDLPGTLASELDRLTGQSSWNFDADAFVRAMIAVLETPLGARDDDPSLRDLDGRKILKELEFELPLRARDSAISLPDLAEVALEYLNDDDPHRPYFSRLGSIDPYRFRGFMAGAIDIVTVLPGPKCERYVVMDFKSNTLPSPGDQPDATDYGPTALVDAMHHGNYVLQALLYQVALHRYLRLRLAGYDPNLHMGGSDYLFMRGMIGSGTPVVEGERCGVSRWRPPVDLIVAVSDLFAGHR